MTPMSKQKLSITDLVIEITRRCNMACAHCLRGDAQDLDMNPSFLDDLFSRLNQASTIVFTGGEPSLRPDLIFYALRAAKRNHVSVEQVYIVTNGKQIPETFLKACRDWDRYCFLNQYGTRKNLVDARRAHDIIQDYKSEDTIAGCYVSLSMDKFHEPVSLDSLSKLATLPRLMADKYSKDSDPVLNTGRAKATGAGTVDPAEFRPWEYDDRSKDLDIEDCSRGIFNVESLYLAADGALLKHCDYAYTDQPRYTISRIRPYGDPAWLERLLQTQKSAEEETT